MVLAERDYPAPVETGAVIEGVADAEALEAVKVFHAGTRIGRNCGRLKVNGGRVLRNSLGRWFGGGPRQGL